VLRLRLQVSENVEELGHKIFNFPLDFSVLSTISHNVVDPRVGVVDLENRGVRIHLVFFPALEHFLWWHNINRNPIEASGIHI